MTALVLSQDSLNEIIDLIKMKLVTVPTGAKLIMESCSVSLGFCTEGLAREGHLTGSGTSEFHYSDGTVVKANWTLTDDLNMVKIDWQSTTPPPK